jgi:hypothetical protein
MGCFWVVRSKDHTGLFVEIFTLGLSRVQPLVPIHFFGVMVDMKTGKAR